MTKNLPGKTRRNEQKKLFATYLNGIAIGFAVVGTVPVTLQVFGLRGTFPDPLTAIELGVMGGAFLISGLLHVAAQRQLSDLED